MKMANPSKDLTKIGKCLDLSQFYMNIFPPDRPNPAGRTSNSTVDTNNSSERIKISPHVLFWQARRSHGFN
jgi:hypothetical protein